MNLATDKTSPKFTPYSSGQLAVFGTFTIILALAFIALTVFIGWKIYKKWDKANIWFLGLIDVAILAGMIGLALNWGGAIHNAPITVSTQDITQAFMKPGLGKTVAQAMKIAWMM